MAKKPIPAHPEGATMKAVCFSSYGTPEEALAVKDIPKPFVSSDNQVLIKVHACALNPIDKIRLQGGLATVNPEPYETSVLGYDVAGVVEESTSTKFSVGDEVYVRLAGMNYGALAEYVLCGTDEVGAKPKSLTMAEAAGIPLAGLTALQALRHGGAKAGSKVFIDGGAGGVGSLAIPIAKQMLKAKHVCTTASPGAGTDLCLAAGADRVINYREEDFAVALEGEDFDVMFDTMNQASKMGPLLKKGGKVVSISGNPTIEAIESMIGGKAPLMVRFFMWMTRNRAAEKAANSAGGSWEYIFMKPVGKDLDELGTYLESGAIKPVVDTVANGLDDFRTAIDKLYSGRSKGKCVIQVVV
jgi:NADPH:quinone reductase-like Zn-dependent oxidoreductase